MNEVALKTGWGSSSSSRISGCSCWLSVIWLFGAFLTDEMTTTVAIIAPFLATYTTAIIKYIAELKNKVLARGRPVTSIFVFMSFCIPGAFVMLLVAAVLLKAFNIGLRSFEDFKIMLATVETIFGVYVGQLIFSLFERPEADQQEPAGNHHEGKSDS